MSSSLSAPSSDRVSPVQRAVRDAYETAGRAYEAYADGGGGDTLAIDGPHAEADRRTWRQIDAQLVWCRELGQRTLRVLDAGCGPGTWLARVAARATALGFADVELVGFDLSAGMADAARARLARGGADRGRGRARVRATVEAADACEILPRLAPGFDLVLCLYSVLNHLPAPDRPPVAAGLARATKGRLLVSVRAAGSLPTIYIDRIEQARDFRQDDQADRLEVDLKDGTHLTIPSHLFRAAELDRLFAPHFGARCVTGLDLFHARFAADPRWSSRAMEGGASFLRRLDALEQECAADPDLIDHATHLLLRADAAG